MARWIVDAMNVIGSRPTGWWRDRPGAVRSLAARLERLAEERGQPMTLVVDGAPLGDLPEGQRGELLVLYARRRGPDAADDRIVELVRAADDPAGLCVVTSDRGLRARVTALAADVVPAGELLRLLDARDGR